MRTPACSCGRPAVLTTGAEIYPHRADLHRKHFWLCRECNAYVGCHGGGKMPLGNLAGPELRALRQRAHRLFDQLWDGPKAPMTRTTAYSNLRRWLHLSSDEAHIGKFDETYCMALINKCKQIGLKEE